MTDNLLTFAVFAALLFAPKLLFLGAGLFMIFSTMGITLLSLFLAVLLIWVYTLICGISDQDMFTYFFR